MPPEILWSQPPSVNGTGSVIELYAKPDVCDALGSSGDRHQPQPDTTIASLRAESAPKDAAMAAMGIEKDAVMRIEKDAAIAEKDAAIAEKDATIASLRAESAAKDAAIAAMGIEKDAAIAEKDATIADMRTEKDAAIAALRQRKGANIRNAQSICSEEETSVVIL